MVIKKTDRLQIKTASGVRECEIVRITKVSIDVRESKYAGQSTRITGFTTYSVRHFFSQIKAGVITVLD